MERNRKRIILVGCGALGTIIAEGICNKLSEDYELSAVYDYDRFQASKLAAEWNIPIVTSLEEIIKEKPDYVVEAASQNAIFSMALPVIEAGIDMVILSVGALSDNNLKGKLEYSGRKSGAKLYVASGAIGGFDLMRAVRFGGLQKAKIHTRKNPHSLNGAPYLNGRTLADKEEQSVFLGNAGEAIIGFPKNVNVAVAMALATLGIEHTEVEISSCPQAKENTHCINLDGNFGSVRIEVAVKPSDKNAKSSTLAAWSVLALLEKMAQTIVI